jgi:molybdate transport system ATP-binding protein
MLASMLTMTNELAMNRISTADKLVPTNEAVEATRSSAASGTQADTLEVRVLRHAITQEREFVLDVEFRAEPGFTILFGPSGAGKTTLLDCIAGLVAPDAGRIAISGRALFDADRHLNLAPSVRRIGYVFQDLALFPHLTVEQNVQYGLAHLSGKDRRHRTAAMLESFRIPSLARRYPKEISGGERQRVALARTLVTDPAALLLDEPMAALDAATKAKIFDDSRAWNAAHGIPILYVTHNREEVFALGERAIVLDRGRILAQGTPHEVLGAPSQETVAQLAGFENIFDATVESRHADKGTMTCRLVPSRSDPGYPVQLETPLVRAEVGAALRVGVRAGDILLAVERPSGLSARNVMRGRLTALEEHDVIVSARVDCGVEMEVHLTLAARDTLQLQPGQEVWLVIKTHSCHLMQC